MGKEKFYRVKRETHPDLDKHADPYYGIVFIKITKDNKLEKIFGDHHIAEITEINNNELKIKKDAVMKYQINELNLNQFKLFLADYQERKMKYKRKKRIRSMRIR